MSGARGNIEAQQGQLAGGRYDLCLVFPYKVRSNVKWGDHNDQMLQEATAAEKSQMDNWQRRRNMTIKQLQSAGLDCRPFYSRDKTKVFVKIGTDVEKLRDLAELTKYKLQMKDEYLGAYAPYVKDFPGRPEVNYRDRKKVSHVYKPHNPEGSEFEKTDSIFRTADRVLLLDHAIRSKEKGCASVDVAGLVKTGDLLAYFPLHESRKLEDLDTHWFKNFVTGAGVDAVRDYYGERVAFYFGWMAHFSKWLAIASCLGVLFSIVNLLLGTPNNFLSPHFCFFIAAWAVLFTHFWRRKAAGYALQWGVHELQIEDEAPRPEFRGTKRVNPITEKQDVYFDWSERLPRLFFSYTIIAICMVACLLVTAFVFIFRHKLHDMIPHGRFVFMVVLAIAVDVTNTVFTHIAKALNEWENYRTQSDFEKALLLKTVVFKFVNSYAALFYIAFFKNGGSLLGVQMTCMNDDCIVDLAWQLTVFFLYRLIASNLGEMVWPKIKFTLASWVERRNYAGAAVLQDMSLAEQQMKKEAYDVFDDFDEMVVQFGYVTLFVVAVPWLPLAALLANVLEAWIDKKKLLADVRRPLPMKAKGNGAWDVCFEAMGVLAVLTNAALIVFATKSFESYSLSEKVLWFVLIEHVLIGLRLAVNWVFPAVPEHVRVLALKHKHIVHKNVDCVEDEDENMRMHAMQRDVAVVINDVDDDDDD